MEPTTSPPSFSELRRKYFGPLLATALLLRFVAHNLSLILQIPVHPDITFPEGALVAGALDVAQGQTPYHDWRQWPHRFSPYPPLTYYPVGWMARTLAAPPTPSTSSAASSPIVRSSASSCCFTSWRAALASRASGVWSPCRS